MTTVLGLSTLIQTLVRLRGLTLLRVIISRACLVNRFVPSSSAYDKVPTLVSI